MNTQEEKLRESFKKLTKKMLIEKLENHYVFYRVRDKKEKLISRLVEKELEILDEPEPEHDSEQENKEQKLRETYNKRSFTKKMLIEKLDKHCISYRVKDKKSRLIDLLVETELELTNENEPEPEVSIITPEITEDEFADMFYQYLQ